MDKPAEAQKAKIPAWPSISRATATSTTEHHEKAHHGKFATAINCMDGRVQLPVINWLMENLSVDYVDIDHRARAGQDTGGGDCCGAGFDQSPRVDLRSTDTARIPFL